MSFCIYDSTKQLEARAEHAEDKGQPWPANGSVSSLSHSPASGGSSNIDDFFGWFAPRAMPLLIKVSLCNSGVGQKEKRNRGSISKWPEAKNKSRGIISFGWKR